MQNLTQAKGQFLSNFLEKCTLQIILIEIQTRFVALRTYPIG